MPCINYKIHQHNILLKPPEDPSGKNTTTNVTTPKDSDVVCRNGLCYPATTVAQWAGQTRAQQLANKQKVH